MSLPNLSALRQQPTGRLQNANAWLFVQRLKKDTPNRDPITTEDWRAGVRKAEEDGPAPKDGWVLEVDTGDGKRTPEPGYLYDVEALAQHLLNGGVSPISRLPADEDDMRDCIKAANAIRENKGLPPLHPLAEQLPRIPHAERMHELPQLGMRPVRQNNPRTPLEEDEHNQASREAQAVFLERGRQGRLGEMEAAMRMFDPQLALERQRELERLRARRADEEARLWWSQRGRTELPRAPSSEAAWSRAMEQLPRFPRSGTDRDPAANDP